MAVCTSATISGDADSETISQAAPTFCIQMARFIASAPTHSQRNAENRSGAHRESESFVIRRSFLLPQGSGASVTGTWPTQISRSGDFLERSQGLVASIIQGE